ncbi:MAG: DNA-deoxyinosine glycosylase [Lachnospiraceae bacterium]|nr:DNA-deoxyinosine glycosylase [Lachnospiraceae bacterium]MDE6252384.1 DNA-deoxyinosine glycosylase [Lachnospiraceae bacterium]
MEYNHADHLFGPVFDEHSKILILGSFPSVKSREQNFYYGHPQNRFWKVLLSVCKKRRETVETIEQKKKFLLDNRIALWDVIESCDIKGSSDSSIKNIKVNDLNVILKKSNIEKIILNGKKSHELYKKYYGDMDMPDSVQLPSTSPANAAWSLEQLIEVWGKEISITDI